MTSRTWTRIIARCFTRGVLTMNTGTIPDAREGDA